MKCHPGWHILNYFWIKKKKGQTNKNNEKGEGAWSVILDNMFWIISESKRKTGQIDKNKENGEGAWCIILDDMFWVITQI